MDTSTQLADEQKPPLEKRSIRRLFLMLGRFFLLLHIVLWCILLVLRFVPPPTSAFMLAERWDQGTANSYRFVTLESMNAYLPLAAVAAEDQLFFQHFGLDLVAIQTVLYEGARGGASTITQQLCKNLFFPKWRSLLRKVPEAYCALWADLLLGKRRTLELYLNVAQFGPSLFGVEAAAERYFGRGAEKINIDQAALMMAALPNPVIYQIARPGPKLLQKKKWVKQQMQQLELSWVPWYR